MKRETITVEYWGPPSLDGTHPERQCFVRRVARRVAGLLALKVASKSKAPAKGDTKTRAHEKA